MVDINKLRKLVQNFEFYSRPSNRNRSEPCTIGDLNKAIDSVSKVLSDIIDELESEQ